jgi:hypothetical protein
MFLAALLVYMNVLASDAGVLEQAEQVARAKVGCKECSPSRVEGTSRVLDKKYAFTFDPKQVVTVVCRRAYIGFGDFACSAR